MAVSQNEESGFRVFMIGFSLVSSLAGVYTTLARAVLGAARGLERGTTVLYLKAHGT